MEICHFDICTNECSGFPWFDKLKIGLFYHSRVPKRTQAVSVMVGTVSMLEGSWFLVMVGTVSMLEGSWVFPHWCLILFFYSALLVYDPLKKMA